MGKGNGPSQSKCLKVLIKEDRQMSTGEIAKLSFGSSNRSYCEQALKSLNGMVKRDLVKKLGRQEWRGSVMWIANKSMIQADNIMMSYRLDELPLSLRREIASLIRKARRLSSRSSAQLKVRRLRKAGILVSDCTAGF